MIKEMIIKNSQVNADVAYIEYIKNGTHYYRRLSIGQAITFGLWTEHEFAETPNSTILNDVVDYQSNTVKDNDLFLKYIDHLSRDKKIIINTLN